MQLVGALGLGPRLAPHALDGLGVEPTEIGGRSGVQPTPARHRPGASLLERRIVQEGVGLGVQDLLGERRGLGQITGDDPRLAARDLPEQALEPLDIHGLAEAVA